MKKFVSSMLVAAMCLTMWPQAAPATDVPETVAHGPMVQAAGQQADFATNDNVKDKEKNKTKDEKATQQQPKIDAMSWRAEMMGGTAVMAASAEDEISTYDGEGTQTPAATTVTVGNVTVSDANAANVLGDGKVKYDAATNTLTLTNANITTSTLDDGTFIDGMVCCFGVKSSGDLTVNLVGNNTITVPANDDATYSVGLYAEDLQITGTGTLTVTAAAAQYSYGVWAENLTVGEGVTLNATGGTFLDTDNERADSTGIYAYSSIDIGKNAKVTAKGGNVTNGKVAYSNGILLFDYDGVEECYIAGTLTVADGAVLTATGGAVSTPYVGCSYGIEVSGSVEIGKATVTATGGTATAGVYGYSCGIYDCSAMDEDWDVMDGIVRVKDGAVLTATGGNVTVTEIEDNYNPEAESHGIYSNAGVEIGAATVNATGGTVNAAASSDGYSEACSYGILADCVDVYYYDDTDETVYMGGVNIGDNAKVTATGGKTTAYYAISSGIYCDSDSDGTLGIEVGANATVTATGAEVSGEYELYSAGIYNYGYMEVGANATVNATGKNATITGDDEYTTAYSYGVYVYEEMVLGEKATLTGTSGNVTAVWFGESCGVCVDYDMLVKENAKLTGTGGNVTSEENGYSYGVYADDGLLMDENATLTGTGGNVIVADYGESDGVCVYYDMLVKENAKLTGTSGTVQAGADGDTYGVYCSYRVEVEDGATLTGTAKSVTADEDAFSNGVYAWKGLEVGAKATVNGTGGDVTAFDSAYSNGIYVRYSWYEKDEDDEEYDYISSDGRMWNFYGDLTVGDGATVTGRGGKATSGYSSGSYGVYVYGDYYEIEIVENEYFTYYYGDIIIGQEAKVTGTAGNATLNGWKGYSNYVYSYGISAYANMQVGEKATVTATAGNATADTQDIDYCYVYGYDTGVYVGCDMTVADEATVVATGGNVTAAGECCSSVQNGGMWIYGGLDIGKATVVASAGTVAASTVSPRGSYADSWGTYAKFGVQIAEGGVLKTTGGTATYINPNNAASKGKYVDACSYGLKIGAYGITLLEDHVIKGSLVATGGNAYGSYDATSGEDNNGRGYAGSYGLCGNMLDVQVADGANVKLQSGRAETTCTNDDVTAYSNALWMAGADFTMDGGAVYVISGAAVGGETNTDTDGINVWSRTYDNETTLGGDFTVNGGWLKVETDEEAILTSNEPVLGDSMGIVTPEGGEFKKFTEAATDNYDAYDYWAVVKDDTKAATVVIWDSETKEFKAPVININTGSSSSGGGGSSKKDTTKEEETKDETKTDEVAGDTDNKFTDVKEDDYFGAAVDWATGKEITGGTTATTFGPYEACTRAQVVTFLWRAAGCPTVDSDIAFTDVDDSAYYAEAIRWAASLGIVDGYGDGTFGPNDTVTREQVAAILFRFAKAEGLDTTQGGMMIREFNDYESISEYAIAAMQWAVNAGIMQGYDNNLTPEEECIRAQIVTMLYRLLGE